MYEFIKEGFEVIKPMGLFVVGMVLYCVFVFKFYRFLSRRDIFELDLNKYNRAQNPIFEKIIASFFYVVEYVLLFPLFAFFWLAFLSVLLSFLADYQSLNTILLVSIALVSTVRVTAYHNEELSRDIAKMLPFALLGVFLVEIDNFSWTQSWGMLKQLPDVLMTLVYYFIFVVLLEFVMRILYGIRVLMFGEPKQEED